MLLARWARCSTAGPSAALVKSPDFPTHTAWSKEMLPPKSGSLAMVRIKWANGQIKALLEWSQRKGRKGGREKRRRNETGDLWQEPRGYELYLQQVVFQIISAGLPRGFGWLVCLFCFVSLYFCFNLMCSIWWVSCQHYAEELSNTIAVFYSSFCDSGQWDFWASRQTDSSCPKSPFLWESESMSPSPPALPGPPCPSLSFMVLITMVPVL